MYNQTFLYHGSSRPDIKTFIPQIRSTPIAHKDNPVPAIYATDDKAYAAAHAFLWSSDEGFDTYYKDGKIVLEVPELKKGRLNQPIYTHFLVIHFPNLMI